jgi:DinB superfamily
LIHGEKTDWVPRTKIILSDSNDKNFAPFNRFAQLTKSRDKTIAELLDEFKKLRNENLDYLRSLHLDEVALNKTGMHTAFGEVSLQQLLATWTVHDLNHIAQIVRVIAKQYKEAVGPWVEYLRVLQ